jgi:hypothetical protein
MLLRADSPWLAAVAVTAIYAGVSWSLGPPEKPAAPAPASAPRPAASPPAPPRARPAAPQRLTADAASPQPTPQEARLSAASP